MSAQQKRWLEMIEDRYRSWDDEFDTERYRAKQQHLLETQFRLRESADQGETPDPEDFELPEILQDEADGDRRLVTAGSATPASAPDQDDDDEEDEDDGEDEDDVRADFELKPFDEQEQNPPGDEGGENVAIAPPPGPPESFIEDPYAHPLADYYRQFFILTDGGLFTHDTRNLETMIQLMKRQPDEFYPAPPNTEEE